MKYLSIALAALAGISEARRPISSETLKSRMKKGQFNKRALMKAARPYNKQTEREMQDFEINGLYSIRFNSCTSLTIASEDLFDENFIYFAQTGQVVAEKSYVLFDVCYSEDCYYAADDAKMTFLTDLGTFFQALSGYIPTQVESYCEGCEQNQDYCYTYQYQMNGQYQQDGQYQQGDQYQYNGQNNGGRNLQEVEMIDCDKCFEMECFDDGNANNNYGYQFEDSFEWLNGLSECQQLENAYNNNEALYAGLICNDDGTGVEIGVFLDNACSLYFNQQSFANVMSYDDQAYFQLSQEVVQYTFTNEFSCASNEVEYTNPYEQQQQQYDGDYNQNYNQNYNYEVPEAGEWCQDLFGGEMEAINLYSCGQYYNNNQGQYYNGQDQGDGQYYNGQDQGDGQYYNGQNQGGGQYYDGYQYDWYSYQLSEDDLENPYQVCSLIKSLEGETNTIYNSQASGSLYDYSQPTYTTESSEWNDTPRKRFKSGQIGAVAAVLVVLVAGTVGIVYALRRRSSSSDKATPLVNGQGTMA